MPDPQADSQLQQDTVAFNARYEQEQSKAVNIVHEMKRALYEDYFVPVHEPRTASGCMRLGIMLW